MSVDRDEVWASIKPFVGKLIDNRITDVTSSSSSGVSPHTLSGTAHTGTLSNTQAPQFLLVDGTRGVTGNLAVSASVTIDGVDLSAFKALYDIHITDPDAHHLRFVSMPSDSGTAVPSAAGALTVTGGNGIGSTGAGNTLTINLDTPTTLTVATTNATSTGHTHAIVSSSTPGAAASLVATASTGNLTLGTNLLNVDVVNTRVGLGMAPAAARVDVTGGSAEAAQRIQSSVTTANAIEWLATALTTGALVNATLPAARTVLQSRVSGDSTTRMALTQSSLLWGTGSANPDVVLRRASAGVLVADDNALGGAVDLAVSRKGTFGSVTPGTALLTAVNPGGEHLRLAYDASNYVSFTTDNGGNLTLVPTGDLIFDPVGNDVRPQTNYDLNLGMINKKWLTIHAAELWVETLVAQDTIATIGGRILVGPTTQLTADLLATGTDQTITRRAFRSAVGTSTSPLVTAPTGTTNNDVLLISLTVGASTATTVTAIPTGARLLRSTANPANTAQLLTYVIPINTSVPTLGFTLSASVAWIVGAVAYQNVKLAVIENITTFQANASGVNMTAPAMTTTVTNTMLVYVAGTAVATTVTPPTSMTEVIDTTTTGITMEIAELLQAAAGTTGARVGVAANAGSNATHLIALTPRMTSSVVVKHNQMQAGDSTYMEAAGFIEFMTVISGPTGTGPYTYVMARDLDGTGANAWNAGDALFNTGQAGSGFIDLYSLAGVNGMLLDGISGYTNGAAASPFEGGTYSANYAQETNYQYFNSTMAVNDSMYFGLTAQTWNNIYLNVLTALAATGLTSVWEYWNGTAWTTFTPTLGGTGSLASVGALSAEWSLPLQGWVLKTINGLSAYWVRQRVTAITSVTTYPRQGSRRTYWRKRTAGPTIVGNVRNSTAFNDWSEHWAVGNLNGLYDYSTDVYGAAFGKYTGAASTTPWVSADATNGFRVMRGSTKLAQWDTSGNITIGQVASGVGNLFLSSGALQTRINTTVKLDAQSDGDVFIGSNVGTPSTTNLSIFANVQTYNGESMASGDVLFGDNSASRANIKWTPVDGRLRFRGGTTTQLYIDTTGTLVAGGGNVGIDAAGFYLTRDTTTTGGGSPPVPGTFPIASRAIRWLNGAAVHGQVGTLTTTYTGGGTTENELQLYAPYVSGQNPVVTAVALNNSGTGSAASRLVATDGSTAAIVKAGFSSAGGTNITLDATDTYVIGGVSVGTASAAGSGSIKATGVLYLGNQTAYWLQHTAGTYPGLYTNGSYTAGSAMFCSNWFRSGGQTGWYSNTYGGGIRMQNSTSVEVYGGKQFYAASGAGIGVDPTVFVGTWMCGIQGTNASAGTYALVVRNATPTNLMYVENNGALFANAAWTISDEREKHDIQPLTDFSWNSFMALAPVDFIRNISGMRETGFIAQAVQKVIPNAVYEGMEGILGLSQMTLLTHTIAAIQDLKQEHEERIPKLLADNQQLRTRLERLEQMFEQHMKGHI